MAILVKMIPDAVQGIINGASLGSATPTVGGMARTAGSVAVGAAVGAAGGAMAVREASKLAGEQLGGGGALASAVAPGGGSLGGSSFLGVPAGGSPGGGNSPSAGTGPLPMPGSGSSAAGVTSGAGRMGHAGQTMKNLTKAAGETLGGKIMGDYNASHGSFGGSMAQKLRAERLGMSEGGEPAHTGGQSSGQTGAISGTIRAASSSGDGSTHNQTPQATHNRPHFESASSEHGGSDQPYMSPARRLNDEQ